MKHKRFPALVLVIALLWSWTGIPSLLIAEDEESLLLPPPKHTYTKDQLNVIQKFGLPWQFNIVFDQRGKLRYETWYYGGKIRKKFGFVNGKQELLAAFRFPLLEEEKVVGLEPRDFTFGTIPRHMKVLFGTATKILRTSKPGFKHESHGYVTKGVGATFINRKIDTVATIPPFKKSSNTASASMFLSELTNDVEFKPFRYEVVTSDVPEDAPGLAAARAIMLAGLMITLALRASESTDPDTLKNAENLYVIATILIVASLNTTISTAEMKQAIKEFTGLLKEAADCSEQPGQLAPDGCSVKYVNNLTDISSTMEKTTNRSDSFPVTLFNDTHITGRECGEPPIPLKVFYDNNFAGSMGPGKSLTTLLAPGAHGFNVCGDGDFGCVGGTFNVPEATVGHFIWICNPITGAVSMK